MSKLKLDLDALQVETFHTREIDTARGTVDGHFVPPDTATCGGSCVVSCAGSCVNTCAGNTCWGTCLDTCANTCAFTCGSCGDPTCTHNSHFPYCVE